MTAARAYMELSIKRETHTTIWWPTEVFSTPKALALAGGQQALVDAMCEIARHRLVTRRGRSPETDLEWHERNGHIVARLSTQTLEDDVLFA